MPAMFKACFSDIWEHPSKVTFMGKDKDEKLILLMRRHIITNLPWAITGAALFFLPMFLTFLINLGEITAFDFLSPGYISVLLIFWYLIVFMYFFENYLVWFFNVYLVTNKRLVDVDFLGVINVQVTDAPIENVQDVTYSVSGIVETVFNFGDVKIQTAGERREVEFEMVPNPSYVQDVVSDLASGVNNEL